MPRAQLTDWAAIAETVADEQRRPVLVLDGRGFIRLINRMGAELLGVSRGNQLVGRHFRELFVNPCNREQFKGAVRGAFRSAERELRTADGRLVQVLVDLAPVGRGKRKGLIVTVMTATPVRGEGLPEDLDYEISTDLSDFGRLQRVLPSSGQALHLVGRLCYEVLMNAKTPCNDCPALRPSNGWPRVTVRSARDGRGTYEVVTAMPHGRSLLRVKVRQFTNEMLAAVFDARVVGLADQADLTERERSMLKYLVMGRHISDIATIMGISLRTVKFHQANILRKLGADSRIDLMRLVM